MERWEIEARLNRSRADLLETYAAMSALERAKPATVSERDHAVRWTAGDHFLHIIDPEQQVAGAIERQLAGDEFPYPPMFDSSGARRERADFLTLLHTNNDAWLAAHRELTFDEIAGLGATTRARTLQLLGELDATRLAEPLRNMPWSVFAANIGELFMLIAQHGESHYAQAMAGLAANEPGPGHRAPSS